jgi:hypothetical protein
MLKIKIQLPQNIEEVVADSKVPSLWKKATGKNYNSNCPSVNDLRRFVFLCLNEGVRIKNVS